MIVTIICDVLGELNNGTSIAANNLIQSLKAKGHEVRVVCPDRDKDGLPGYYICDQMNFGLFNNYVHKNGVSLAKADTKLLTDAIKDADVVHILLPFSIGRKAIKIARKLHKPITGSVHVQAENITSHVGLMGMKGASTIIYKDLYHYAFRYYDCIHYPTEFIRETVEKATKKKSKAYVISNGVNKAFVKKESKRPNKLDGKYLILFTGRYSKEKCHQVLIDSVQYSKYKDKIQLIFAGEGPLKDHLKEYALQQKLPNQPIMQFFSRKDIINTINYCDLYVHPAEIEIEAISCLEAISCGLVPVIADSPRSATRYFALKEDNLFEYNNPKSLAERIDYWIEHPEEKALRSQEYLGYTKQFDFDLCMDRMEQMLKDAIEINKKKYK